MNGACGDSLSECVTKPLDKNLEKENHCLQNYFNIFLIIISATVSDGAKKTLKGRSTNILRKEYERDVLNAFFLRRRFKSSKFYK